MPETSKTYPNAGPVRLQRSRAKGSRLVSPNGLPVVCVTRPGVFGNPFGRDVDGGRSGSIAVEMFHAWLTWEPESFRGCTMPYEPTITDWVRFCEERCCTLLYEPTDERRQMILARLHELRWKNLACWCGLDKPCHADVLLELANKPEVSNAG